MNRYPSTAIGPDGKSYNVEFSVHGSVVTEIDALQKAKDNVGANYDAKMNFVRVDDGTQRTNSYNVPALDFIGKDGEVPGSRGGMNVASPDNAIWINTNDLCNTSWIHEVVAHGLGNRGPWAHIKDWNSKDNPSTKDVASIKTALTTINIPKDFGTFDAKAGRIVLNTDKRGVLPQDKSQMLLRFWTKDADGTYRGVMGASTNTIFSENGTQTFFDKNGNKQTNDKLAKTKKE